MAGGDPTISGNKITRRQIWVTLLTLGTWNVCILMDYDGADRPEWRSARIASDLARYKVQIVELSDTWLAEEGQLTDIGKSYTYFWIGAASMSVME